jgi:hypothetical protein
MVVPETNTNPVIDTEAEVRPLMLWIGIGGNDVIFTTELRPRSGNEVMAMVVPDTVIGTEAKLLTVTALAAPGAI